MRTATTRPSLEFLSLVALSLIALTAIASAFAVLGPVTLATVALFPVTLTPVTRAPVVFSLTVHVPIAPVPTATNLPALGFLLLPILIMARPVVHVLRMVNHVIVDRSDSRPTQPRLFVSAAFESSKNIPLLPCHVGRVRPAKGGAPPSSSRKVQCRCNFLVEKRPCAEEGPRSCQQHLPCWSQPGIRFV